MNMIQAGFTLWVLLILSASIGGSAAALAQPSAPEKYDPRDWRNIRIKKIPGNINSTAMELVSCFSKDGRTLWFSTKRGLGVDQLAACDYAYGQFDEPVITPRHLATGAFTMDDNDVSYFARLNPLPDSLLRRKQLPDSINPNNIDIYCALPGSSAPMPLPSEINSWRWESQPHITRDGKTIYYAVALEKKKPEVNVDIYVSRLIDGRWTKGSSIGQHINTPDYEGYPVISPDKKFMFFMRRRIGQLAKMLCVPLNLTGRAEAFELPADLNTGREMTIAFHPTENMFVIGSARHSADGKDYDLYEVRYDLR
jgi:hypothetical protein